ncbi:MAG: SCP2 sterol-binding domain-containing protein [Pseudomonadota bacterium]
MSVDDDALKQAADGAFKTPFGGVLRLQVGGEAGRALVVDGRVDPPVISTATTDEVHADCAIYADEQTFVRALMNDRALTASYVSGRLAIAGDMSVIARVELGSA